MSAIIEVNNLGKKYLIGEKERYLALRDKLAHPIKALKNTRSSEVFWALSDISFSVEKGEVLGIIGKNGSGKSTLLKILSKITPPTTGEVCLRGRVGSLLEVGTGFHPELTGRENIYLSGSILGMRKKEIDKKFEEIVNFSGVEAFLDTPIKRYSSGMSVRLGFAVAAHLEPEILLVDEVLAVGDAEFQKKCLGKMGEITKQGARTIIFISHNMAAINQLCDRVLLLENGHIKKNDTPESVVSEYLRDLTHQGGIWERTSSKTVAEDHFVKSVILQNSKKINTRVFFANESIRIQCCIVSKKQENIFLAVGIRDVLSNQIIHLNSKNQKEKLQTKAGKNMFQVEFENILSAGEYYVTVWIGDASFVTQDYVRDCISFSVDLSNLDTSYHFGSVIVPATWSMVH